VEIPMSSAIEKRGIRIFIWNSEKNPGLRGTSDTGV
jgi:hypothetical protein